MFIHYFIISIQNPALQEDGGSGVLQFADFGLHKELLNGLKEMGIKTPTNVQVCIYL